MITIAGNNLKIIFISLFFFASLRATDLALKLTTVDGAALKEAGVGQPFLLNVVVTNANNTAQYPQIDGLEHFHVRQSGFQMNMVNGNTSVSYQYQIRIDTAGTYRLGPARITQDSASVESEPISITVGPEQKMVDPKKNAHAKSSQSFLRLTCDKERAFVGQKLHCSLFFYTSDASVSLQGLHEPEQITNGIQKSKSGPTTGTQMFQNVEHRFARWDWDIIPQKAGTCVIPAYAADYVAQVSNTMFSFFLSRHETKRVYSNTLSIPIDALPDHKELPRFIGTISDIQAKIEPAVAKVGEGMVITITVTGDGDFDNLAIMPLKKIPEDLKWYDSKQATGLSKDHSNQIVHSMEYIIQALQPGIYQIPAQELSYFDTGARAYKVRATTPLTITIKENTNAVPVATKQSPEPQTNLTVPQTQDIRPLHEEGPWASTLQWHLPWPLFWLIIILLIVAWAIAMLATSSVQWINRFLLYWSKSGSPYSMARAQIRTAHHTKQYQSLYGIFMRLFAARAHIEQSQLSAEVIEALLLKSGLSTQAIKDWHIFFNEIAQISFAQPAFDQQFYDQLTQQALYWVDIFEKLPAGDR